MLNMYENPDGDAISRVLVDCIPTDVVMLLDENWAIEVLLLHILTAPLLEQLTVVFPVVSWPEVRV